MSPFVINLFYLIAAVLFIYGLKGLTHPRTAVRGNMISAGAMLLAIIVTLLDKGIVGYGVILAGIVIGAAIGAVLAIRVQMTEMPQLVALFNGFGGIASLIVAGAEMAKIMHSGSPELDFLIATAAAGLIGAITFWGSLVAFGKLQGLVSEKPLLFKGRHLVNGGLLCISILFAVLMILHPSSWLYWLLGLFASGLGILLVMPIGGADMPVVISLLNSYSGLAACATGFVINNNVLIISGSLVGASGLILTSIMCKAMNRSLANVIFAGVGAAPSGDTVEEDIYTGRVRSTSPDEVAMLLESSQRVVFVPGYGMAVAQAQHAVRDLANLLEQKGIEVEYAIHPVAGRMPGHMNVLLAEANIEYEKLKEMDDINPSFKQTDVAIVIGANDVVNPVARTDPKSPIAGMPILDVDQARAVVVIKRSLSHGFAGIPNPLFVLDNTMMLFGDGKKMVMEIITAFKEL